jgi:hypothetical protein
MALGQMDLDQELKEMSSSGGGYRHSELRLCEPRVRRELLAAIEGDCFQGLG